jgi:hypothetical protein
MLRNYTLVSESEAMKAVQHKERRHLFNESSTCCCEVSAMVYGGGQTTGELEEKVIILTSTVSRGIRRA